MSRRDFCTWRECPQHRLTRMRRAPQAARRAAWARHCHLRREERTADPLARTQTFDPLSSLPGPATVRSRRRTLLDRRTHRVPPFSPAPVIVPHFLVAEKVCEHEPCVRRAFANAAICDDVVAWLEVLFGFVDRTKLVRRLERAIRVCCSRPWNAARATNVPCL